MLEAFMQNFTLINIIILVSSIFIGIYCLKMAKCGIFVKYRWVVLIFAFAFTYEVATGDASHLHMLPFALFLWAMFVVSYQILLGKREPIDADEDTLAEIEKIRKRKKTTNSSVYDKDEEDN
ncbi:MAG: hypothetical protein MJ146_04485 [Clostridia bacterium]|nr:hypothetical protein [Clostridia bacterium]